MSDRERYLRDFLNLPKSNDTYSSGSFLVVGDPHLASKNPRSRKDQYSITVLDKLRQIGQIVKETEDMRFVLLLGDLFHLKDQPHYYTSVVAQILRKMGVPVYTIIGNHDIYWDRIDSIGKTPVSILMASGVLKWLDVIKIGNLFIRGYDYQRIVTLNPESHSGTTMAVAHAFYRFEHSVDGTIDEQSIEDAGYDYLLLGHDHMPYSPLQRGKTSILRPGSLTRGTIHDYNMTRDVQVYVMHVDDTGPLMYRPHILNVQPASDIFKEASLSGRDVRKSVSEFVKKMQEQKEAVSQDIMEALCKLTDEAEVLRFCEEYLREFSLIV